MQVKSVKGLKYFGGMGRHSFSASMPRIDCFPFIAPEGFSPENNGLGVNIVALFEADTTLDKRYCWLDVDGAYHVVADANRVQNVYAAVGDPMETAVWVHLGDVEGTIRGNTAYAAPNNNMNLKIITTSSSTVLKVPSSAGFCKCQSLTGIVDVSLMKDSPSNSWTFMSCYCIEKILNLDKWYSPTIYTGLFSGCTGLVGDLIIPNNIEAIERNTFQYCSGLDGTLYLPNSITTDLVASVFASCGNLTGIDLESGFNVSLSLQWSSKLSVESLIKSFFNLSDNTGNETKTFAIGAANISKINAAAGGSEAIAAAQSKNWTIV